MGDHSEDNKGASILAVASLMAGIAGFLFTTTCPYHQGKGFLLSVIALVTGIMTVTQGEKGGKMAVAGIVLGTMGLCFWYICRSTDLMSLVR